MRDRSRSVKPGMILLALAALGLTADLSAAEPCSLANAAGDWQYTIIDTQNPSGSPASVGSFRLERDGRLRGVQTVHVNGTLVEGEILTGTVTVHSDCKGSVSVVMSNTPYPRTAALDITVENHSTEFHSTVSDDGMILAVEARRIDHRNE